MFVKQKPDRKKNVLWVMRSVNQNTNIVAFYAILSLVLSLTCSKYFQTVYYYYLLLSLLLVVVLLLLVVVVVVLLFYINNILY